MHVGSLMMTLMEDKKMKAMNARRGIKDHVIDGIMLMKCYK
jgi:hypothetical protein